jgi:hypothetical protein
MSRRLVQAHAELRLFLDEQKVPFALDHRRHRHVRPPHFTHRAPLHPLKKAL